MKINSKNYLGDDLISKNNKKDGSIYTSKSEIKRAAEVLKYLGVALVNLNKNALERAPLDEELRTAIELAQRIKKEGRRRQLQLIGKILRARDIQTIRAILVNLRNYDSRKILLFYKIKMLCKPLGRRR